jgi:hypothetical protein
MGVNLIKTITLEDGGEWWETLNFPQQVTLGAAQRVFEILDQYSVLLNIDTDLADGVIILKFKGPKRKTFEKLVEIEPFAFAQYFLGQGNLSDQFTGQDISEAQIRDALAHWLDVVIAAITKKLDDKKCALTKDERKIFSAVYEFLKFHRYTKFTKEQ